MGGGKIDAPVQCRPTVQSLGCSEMEEVDSWQRWLGVRTGGGCLFLRLGAALLPSLVAKEPEERESCQPNVT